jgi:hypothetical protein
MIGYNCKVRISYYGEYKNTEDYYIEIPEDTSDDKFMEVAMPQIGESVQYDYQSEDEWSEGDISWELSEWEKVEY